MNARRCATCGDTFTPRGPGSKYCPKHQPTKSKKNRARTLRDRHASELAELGLGGDGLARPFRILALAAHLRAFPRDLAATIAGFSPDEVDDAVAEAMEKHPALADGQQSAVIELAHQTAVQCLIVALAKTDALSGAAATQGLHQVSKALELLQSGGRAVYSTVTVSVPGAELAKEPA